MNKQNISWGKLNAEYISPKIEAFNLLSESLFCQSLQQQDDMESFAIEEWN